MAHNETKLIQMSLFIIGQGPSSETDYCSVEDRNTINANAYGYSDSQGSEDLYVVRDGEDTWRVVVDYNGFVDSDQSESQFKVYLLTIN